MAIIFYRVTATGSYQGQNWNNVWHYRTNDADTPSATEVVNLFNTEWTNALRAIMNIACLINSYYAIRTDELGDYASFDVNLLGQVGSTATGMPPQYASCVTGNTFGSVIRHAYKRFTGVDEVMMSVGGLATAFEPQFDVICNKYVANLNGGSATYVPVAVRYNTASPPSIILSAPISGANFRRFNTQRSRIA